MGATSGAGTAYPFGEPEFTPGFLWDSCYSVICFICMFRRLLFVLLSFFDIRILITPFWYLQTLLLVNQPIDDGNSCKQTN